MKGHNVHTPPSTHGTRDLHTRGAAKEMVEVAVAAAVVPTSHQILEVVAAEQPAAVVPTSHQILEVVVAEQRHWLLAFGCR